MKSQSPSLRALLVTLSVPAVVAGLVSIRPARVSAQTVKAADLVGTWVQTDWVLFPLHPDSNYISEFIWTLRPDTTWSVRVRGNGIEDSTKYHHPYSPLTSWPTRWKLRGDTLFLPYDSAAAGTKTGIIWNGRVARAGDHLVRWQLATGPVCPDTLRRVDMSKPLPPPSLTPPPITVDRTELVGTWVRNLSDSSGVWYTDTLKLGADHSVLGVRRETGAWELYPGDHLLVKHPGAGTKDVLMAFLKIVTVQGQVLMDLDDCVADPATAYKRVGP